MIENEASEPLTKDKQKKTREKALTLQKTNMTMENPPFEDVFPIENGDFPMSC